MFKILWQKIDNRRLTNLYRWQVFSSNHKIPQSSKAIVSEKAQKKRLKDAYAVAISTLEPLPIQVPDHELYGHQAIYFTDHQKHTQTKAVAGKLVVEADKGIAKIPFQQAEDKAKANGAYQRRTGIKT